MRTRTLVAALPLVAAGGLPAPRRPRRPEASAAPDLDVAGPWSVDLLVGSQLPGSLRRAVVRGHRRQRHSEAPGHPPRTGLDNPWDAKRLPGGTLLVTERDRARLSVVRQGKRTTVEFPANKIWVSGETGLMSLAVDPDFAANRRFYTCQGGTPAVGTTCG